MVICANCKAYTDDQQPLCEHCGLPLQPDRMENIALFARDPEAARVARDRERAQLVASVVVSNHPRDFFYDEGRGYRSVLAELLGSVRDEKVAAAGAIFAAYAYLSQNEYCLLRPDDADGRRDEEEAQITLTLLRPWDGQQSIEGALADQAARALTTRESTDKMLRKLMGFLVVMSPSDALGRHRPANLSTCSAFTAIDRMLLMTVLPKHDVQEARRGTYRMLMSFVEADRQQARLLAQETLWLMDWFEQFERDPSIGLPQ